MAYSKENRYKRIIALQQFHKENYVKGQTIEWFYHNKVKPQFNISRVTYLTWLSEPAERLLKELQDDKAKGGANKSPYVQTAMDFTEE